MWNRPQLMSAISDLLFLAGAAALLVAGAVWAARLPLFPLQEVVITQELSELRRDELEYTLAGHLKGNFFSVNLDALRTSLEQLREGVPRWLDIDQSHAPIDRDRFVGDKHSRRAEFVQHRQGPACVG